MKKIIIVLLSLLLLFSITSCEEDKSGEVIETFEEFVYARELCLSAKYITGNDGASDDNVEIDDVSKQDLCTFLWDTDEKYKTLHPADVEITAASGSVLQETFKSTYTNVSISYSLTFNGEAVTGTATVDGTYTVTKTEGVTTTTYDMTVNGTKYLVKYSQNDDYKCTAASINGKAVDVRLLNSDVSLND